MWKIALFVLGLSYLVLLVLLRSVVLPLKAVVMNLLSVGASYGVLVAVFQWGWIDGFLGFQSTGSIDTIVPPLVLAVVFGLSMDYEVFLLSRIRERFGATGDTRRAVAEGLADQRADDHQRRADHGRRLPRLRRPRASPRSSSSASATRSRSRWTRRSCGSCSCPAAMELLGKWNWWMPKPLARVLPEANLEDLAPQAAPVS